MNIWINDLWITINIPINIPIYWINDIWIINWGYGLSINIQQTIWGYTYKILQVIEKNPQYGDINHGITNWI